jgi:hypothetical protein
VCYVVIVACIMEIVPCKFSVYCGNVCNVSCLAHNKVQFMMCNVVVFAVFSVIGV